MTYTKADAVMIGRAAQGKPWLLGQTAELLETGHYSPEPSLEEKKNIVLQHITDIHSFYGERLGVKFARKHIAWYLNNLPQDLSSQRAVINKKETAKEQYQSTKMVFDHLLQESVNPTILCDLV